MSSHGQLGLACCLLALQDQMNTMYLQCGGCYKNGLFKHRGTASDHYKEQTVMLWCTAADQQCCSLEPT